MSSAMNRIALSGLRRGTRSFTVAARRLYPEEVQKKPLGQSAQFMVPFEGGLIEILQQRGESGGRCVSFPRRLSYGR